MALDAPDLDAPPRTRFREGVRAGVPFAIAGFVTSVSFGVLALQAGFSELAAIVMSAIVFAGSAQFTAVTIIASGGTLGAAVVGAALINARFLPMGASLAPSLPGGAGSRAAQGQAVVDASWALARRPGGGFDRFYLFGATALQYLTWVTGTIAGVFGGGLLGDTDRLGLDAVYPAFFLALLVGEVRGGRAWSVAGLGALIALVLVPFTPAGVPVLVASLAALTGLWGRQDQEQEPA